MCDKHVYLLTANSRQHELLLPNESWRDGGGLLSLRGEGQLISRCRLLIANLQLIIGIGWRPDLWSFDWKKKSVCQSVCVAKRFFMRHNFLFTFLLEMQLRKQTLIIFLSFWNIFLHLQAFDFHLVELCILGISRLCRCVDETTVKMQNQEVASVFLKVTGVSSNQRPETANQRQQQWERKRAIFWNVLFLSITLKNEANKMAFDIWSCSFSRLNRGHVEKQPMKRTKLPFPVNGAKKRKAKSFSENRWDFPKAVVRVT